MPSAGVGEGWKIEILCIHNSYANHTEATKSSIDPKERCKDLLCPHQARRKVHEISPKPFEIELFVFGEPRT